MSAYIVEKTHIQFIMCAIQNPVICRSSLSYQNEAGEWVYIRAGDFEATSKVGNILWQANAKSVNVRYKEQNTVEELTTRDVSLNFSVSPIQLLKALDCLEYQSCEASDWEQSIAAAIIRRLTKLAYQALPGYSSAKWEVTERDPMPAAKVGGDKAEHAALVAVADAAAAFNNCVITESTRNGGISTSAEFDRKLANLMTANRNLAVIQAGKTKPETLSAGRSLQAS